MAKKKYPETIGVIADIHCGSLRGLLNPKNREFRARREDARALRDIWDHWLWTANNWPKLDLLILAGDLIEGQQRKDESIGVHTTDLGEQAKLAEECLAPLLSKLKPPRIIRLVGTKYHEGYHGALNYLDAAIGVEKVRQVANIRLANGEILNAKHEPESKSAMNRGGAFQTEIKNAIIAETVSGLPRATFLMRSHNHQGGMLQTYDKVKFAAPCWQMMTDWAIDKGQYKWQPNYGGALMMRDPLHLGGYNVLIRPIYVQQFKVRD